MTYHLALASTDLRSIALGFTVFSCLPAAVLATAGMLVHATPRPDRSGMYGARGIRLFTALICSVVAGLVAGAILVLPTGMDLSVLTGALIFSLSAGAITWFSRATIPTALISVGTMVLATGALLSVCAVCFPQNFSDNPLTSLSSYFFTARCVPFSRLGNRDYCSMHGRPIRRACTPSPAAGRHLRSPTHPHNAYSP